jgi:hypothetical protein
VGVDQVNRVSGIAGIVLSLVALVTVLIGSTQPPQPDEGTGAHIFQLSVVLAVPVLLLFVATADWARPRRSLFPLVISVTTLVLAFVALYHLEHR